MKKLYFLFSALLAFSASFAQTVPGGDMETWRTTSSGAIVPKTIQAPFAWYGVDSLIIADGQFFGTAMSIPPASWQRQLYEESTVIHGGSHSARMVTAVDSLVGEFPGIMANAKANVTIDIATGSIGPITYTGGTPVSLQIDTVSAWVEYLPGFDSGTHTHGLDTATLLVQAVSFIHGIDSVIGTGFVLIPPSATFTQISAPIVYTDVMDSVGLVRIFFASSGGASVNLDSSVLYVDDVTMTGVPFVSHVAVPTVAAGSDAIKVYPNPATGTLYLSGTKSSGLVCKLFAVNGQVAATKTLTGNDAIDVSYLPAGMYFYTISDNDGTIMQSGKVAVSK